MALRGCGAKSPLQLPSNGSPSPSSARLAKTTDVANPRLPYSQSPPGHEPEPEAGCTSPLQVDAMCMPANRDSGSFIPGFAAVEDPDLVAQPAASETPLSAAKSSTEDDDFHNRDFWKAAVQCMYDQYFEQRLGSVVEILAQLDVRHWRQLLDFVDGVRLFLAQPPAQESPPPPSLPLDICLHLLAVYITGENKAPEHNDSAAPLWYLEAMLLLRFLLQPSRASGNEREACSTGERTVMQAGKEFFPYASADLQPSELQENLDSSGSTGWENGGGGTQADVLGFTPGPWRKHVARTAQPSASFDASQANATAADLPQDSPAPPRAIQLLVRMVCSSAMASFLLTLGSLRQKQLQETVAGESEAAELDHGRFILVLDRTWARHGSDCLLKCQQLLSSLYPDEKNIPSLEGRRSRLTRDQTPSLTGIVASVACHFSAQLYAGWFCPSPANRNGDAISMPRLSSGSSSEEKRFDCPAFITLLCDMGLFSHQQVSSHGSADKFLVVVRDVLRQLLGPCSTSSKDLPEPLPALPLDAAGCHRHCSTPNIKTLARIARTLILAYFTDPARLAASGASSAPGSARVEALAAGSFAGPSRRKDVVRVTEQGPLRRGLAFMEQSPLLQVVHSKLCAGRFDDMTGSTDQLESFALRNLHVLWFDLSRCTSTLKRCRFAKPESGKQKNVGFGKLNVDSGAAANSIVLLVLRNLRLCLAHDWDAKLGTFPYVQLGGSSQVTVQNLAVSVQLQVDYKEGATFHETEVCVQDLEIQLSCASAFSQVLLSAILTIFKSSLEEHIEKQVRDNLLQLLRHEAARWNESTWRRWMSVFPERLVSSGLEWICAHIPPEGVPI